LRSIYTNCSLLVNQNVFLTIIFFQVATDDNYAFIADDATIDIAIASNCDLIKIKEHFIPLTNAFGFPDKSPHTRLFSEQ